MVRSIASTTGYLLPLSDALECPPHSAYKKEVPFVDKWRQIITQGTHSDDLGSLAKIRGQF
jgi:hypothetical protein